MSKLSPGVYIGTFCPVCNWEYAVYFMSDRPYSKVKPAPAGGVPMHWHTVCLCGRKLYEPEVIPVQLALFEV